MKPPLEEKMFYVQDALRLPSRCFISWEIKLSQSDDLLSKPNILSGMTGNIFLRKKMFLDVLKI